LLAREGHVLNSTVSDLPVIRVSPMVKQLAFDLLAPALPTLDNFVVGRNAEVAQRLRALAGATERVVYVWGAPVSGRTHLLQAALAELRRRGSRVLYIAGGAGPPAGIEGEIDAAAVDDVELLSDTAQVAVFNLYNRLRESGGVLIAAGCAPPARLALRPELVTRLAWGLVYEVHALSDVEKAHALAAHAAARGFALPREVVQHLLSHVQRDMRTLIAVLDMLDRYSLEAKRPVTLPLLREMLSEAREGGGERRNEG
jgi:DnaA-homolog protein